MVKQPHKVKRIKQQIEQLQAELKNLIEISTGLNNQVQSAKTKAKQSHFNKKLKKNNIKTLQLLSTLETYNALYEKIQNQ